MVMAQPLLTPWVLKEAGSYGGGGNGPNTGSKGSGAPRRRGLGGGARVGGARGYWAAVSGAERVGGETRRQRNRKRGE